VLSTWRAGPSLPQVFGALLLVALAAGVAIPAWFARPEVSLENAAILMAREIRQAQNRAVWFRSPMRVVFERDGYTTYDLGQRAVGGERRPGLVARREFASDAVFEGVWVEEVEAGGDDALDFSERGAAQEEARILLAYGEERREIRVTGGAGLITIVGTTSGWVDGGL
jgi:hypothetical protein